MYYFSDFFEYHMFGFLFMILFWGLILYGAFLLLRRLPQPESAGKGAMDILKERYARGEITKAEFKLMKKDIGT